MANKMRLTIGGIDLVLTTNDDEAYMQSIANEVNHRIKEIMRQKTNIPITTAAVFVALEFCDQAKKAKINTSSLQNQAKSYADDLANARLETEEARREIERLNKENQMLRGRLSRL